jgi:hypothetical protein
MFHTPELEAPAIFLDAKLRSSKEGEVLEVKLSFDLGKVEAGDLFALKRAKSVWVNITSTTKSLSLNTPVAKKPEPVAAKVDEPETPATEPAAENEAPYSTEASAPENVVATAAQEPQAAPPVFSVKLIAMPTDQAPRKAAELALKKILDLKAVADVRRETDSLPLTIAPRLHHDEVEILRGKLEPFGCVLEAVPWSDQSGGIQTLAEALVVKLNENGISAALVQGLPPEIDAGDIKDLQEEGKCAPDPVPPTSVLTSQVENFGSRRCWVCGGEIVSVGKDGSYHCSTHVLETDTALCTDYLPADDPDRASQNCLNEARWQASDGIFCDVHKQAEDKPLSADFSALSLRKVEAIAS